MVSSIMSDPSASSKVLWSAASCQTPVCPVMFYDQQYVHTHIHACTRTHVRTHTHTRTPTHTHTHTHIYTYTNKSLFFRKMIRYAGGAWVAQGELGPGWRHSVVRVHRLPLAVRHEVDQALDLDTLRSSVPHIHRLQTRLQEAQSQWGSL